MNMISNHQWYLYEIEPSDLKINNVNGFEYGLREYDLHLKDDGSPSFWPPQEEYNYLQDVDSKLQELCSSMTRSLVESKNYASKQGSDLYKEATNNLNSLNSLKDSFDVKEYTSSKLAENISHADKLVLTSEEVINSFERFQNMIEKTQKHFKN